MSKSASGSSHINHIHADEIDFAKIFAIPAKISARNIFFHILSSCLNLYKYLNRKFWILFIIIKGSMKELIRKWINRYTFNNNRINDGVR